MNVKEHKARLKQKAEAARSIVREGLQDGGVALENNPELKEFRSFILNSTLDQVFSFMRNSKPWFRKTLITKAYNKLPAHLTVQAIILIMIEIGTIAMTYGVEAKIDGNTPIATLLGDDVV